MLVVRRKKGESILIEDNIEISIAAIENGTVKLAINAPKEVQILRKELYIEVENENKEAVSSNIDVLRKIKIKNPKTMSRLIEIALNTSNMGRKKDYSRYTRNLLNLLYRMDREAFLQNFSKNCRMSEKKSA